MESSCTPSHGHIRFEKRPSPFTFVHPSAQTVVALMAQRATTPSVALARGHPARTRITEASKNLQGQPLNLEGLHNLSVFDLILE